MTDADFRRAEGFAEEQLYSTTSYHSHDLRGIVLVDLDMTDWNFSGQDLAGANLGNSNLTIAKFNGADLRGVNLSGSTVALAEFNGADVRNANLDDTDRLFLPWAIVDSQTVYNQWTRFFGGFDPQEAGLTLVESPAGDFDANNALDAADIDLLSSSPHRRQRPWLRPMFDLDGDETIDQEDRRVWVKDLAYTWFGDASFDGEFGSGDFAQVFTAGKYEKEEFAGWAEGDWNGDGFFSSRDMVTAFVDGGYEQGPRTDVVAVPEPSTLLLMLAAISLLTVRRRR